MSINVKQYLEDWEKHPMRKPRIDKVVVDICTGKSGETLVKASQLLKLLTGQQPVESKAKQTIREFGIRKRESIAVRVTLRREAAVKFLKRVIQVKNNTLLKKQFDKEGNVAFGIKEHIDIPGVKYDPNIGIFGMNITVNITSPGFRIKRRHIARKKIPKRHRLTPEESMAFLQEEFGIKIAEKEEEYQYGYY